MFRFLKSLALPMSILLLISHPFKSRATHISGADLTYTWVSGNTFELELTLYRDCSGITAPNNVSVNYKSLSCGYDLNVTLNKRPGTGQEITKPCNSSATTCTGGTSPGIQKYEYIGNVTLPAQCSDWVFGYAICCRNCAITTLTFSPPNCSGAPATYIEATLNNLNAPHNSSPVFSNIPVAFFCIGQPFHYNHGAYDLDGDSIVYSFIPPRSAAGTNVTFTPPYSATNPISSSPPLTLSATGDIVLNPTTMEVGVMAILVKEYRAGIIVGSVVRDMQVYTQPCSNVLPTASGVNGTSSFTIAACPGKPLSFNINSSDPDNSQIVSMNWNEGIPGATFNMSNGNRPTGTFSWTPSLSDARSLPYTFIVTVTDNNCPNFGSQTYSYNVIVPPLSVVESTSNAVCANSATGSASAVVTGTGTFQYLWTPGSSTSSSISGILPGTYSVRVTDQYGCTTTTSNSVGSPSVLTSTLVSTTPVKCFGGNSGAASVSASGGTTPYSYSWSPSGGTMSTASTLTAGNYSVTIRDVNNCVSTVTLSINQPSALNVGTNNNSSTCGLSNGSASVIVSGGSSPYTYLWNAGSATSSVISNIPAGAYQVNITDAQNCTITSSVSVANINGPSSNISSVSHVSCFGGNNGSATVNVNGGTAPYNYQWSGSASISNSATNLSAGNYSVQITDANNCTTVSTFVITQASILNTFGTTNPVSCFGGSDGLASVVASGGTAPYTYNWLTLGSTGSSVNGLGSGTYTVHVTDQNGCTSSCTNTVSSASNLIANVLSFDDIKCFGGNDGNASISTSGGTPPYAYSWSPFGGNSPSASGLSRGTYIVSIHDANNCNRSISVSISEPPVLSLSSSTIPAGCGLSNGSANVVVNGGISPYNYSWTPGGGNQATQSNLRSGSYQVSITDAQNCVLNSSIAISNTSGPTSSISGIQDVLCHGGNNGSASVMTSGGTPPFSYQWSNSASGSASVSNLVAATYSVTITDANNCVTAIPFTISEPPAINLQGATTDNQCAGDNSGQASLILSGGNSPYSYRWSPGGETVASIANLSNGTYTAVITDQNGCTSTSVNSVSSPAPLSCSVINNTPVRCYGGNDGSATVLASGGTPPYSYTWTPTGDHSQSATGLSAGAYTVTVLDAHNCTSSIIVTITQPLAININASTTSSTCGQANGTALVTVSGGILPYTYTWNPGAMTTASVTAIAAGNYSVNISDANNCSKISSIIVTNSSGPTSSISTLQHVSCFNGSDGAATVTSVGGALPLRYVWSHSAINSPSVTNLSAGNYTVNIQDANNCAVNLNFNIVQPPAIDVNGVSSPTSCFAGSDGEISVNVSGGVPPYSYSWSTGSSTNSSIFGLASGTYTVSISDQNACIRTSSYTVNPAPLLSAAITNLLDVSCHGGNDGSARISPSGGTTPYSFTWSPYGGNTELATGLDTGTYTVSIRDANNCNSTLSLTINQPPPLNMTSTSTPAGCGLSNGSASINVSGGTRPLSYSWNTGGSNAPTLSNISSGSYQVTVLDAKNCVITSSIAVSNTSGPSIHISALDPVSCYGGNNGHAEVSISIGTAPFTYQWSSSNSAGASVSNLAAGNHSVTVTDSNNCVTAIPFTITQPGALSAFCNSTPASCYGRNDGQVSVHVIGGTTPYSYSWSNGQAGQSTIQVSSGTYTATINDANGCISVADIIVTQPSALILRTISTPATCFGRQDGQGTAQCSGGTPGYSYSWSNGSTSTICNNLSAGTYTIQVTDANGCTESNLATITEPSNVVTSFTKQDVSCFSKSNGIASINANGGTAPYAYLWSGTGDTSATRSNLTVGSYSVDISDNHGCTTRETIQINQPIELQSTIQNSDVSCTGGNDGQASVNCSGGTPPYQYLWNNGNTNSVLSQLSSGVYTIEVKDLHGCMDLKSILIREPSSMSLMVSTAPTICIGQSILIFTQAAGGTGPYNYFWNNGITGSSQFVSPSQSSSYLVKAIDSKGCQSLPDSVNVNVFTGLLAITSGTDSVCEGGIAQLSANASGGNGGPYNYQWSTGSNQQHTSIQPAGTGTYTVSVSDNCGTPPAFGIYIVVVNPKPNPQFIPLPANGCAPLLVPFSTLDPSQNIVSHSWNFGDGSTSSDNQPQHIYQNPGEYTVTHFITNSNHCSAEIIVPRTVIVYPTPLADFYSSPEVALVQSPEFTFSNASTESVKYYWDFGDASSTSTLKDPEHSYRDTGTYMVQLISESIHGCLDTTIKPVRIKGEFAIYIPNAFSPNADGINENFFPLTIGAKEVKMTILDRWGLEIFHSTENVLAWNGKKQGSDQPCQMDVYVYIIQATDMEERQYRYTGRVSLIH